MIGNIFIFILLFTNLLFSKNIIELKSKKEFSFNDSFLVHEKENYLLDLSKINNNLIFQNSNIDLDDHNSVELICEIDNPVTIFFDLKKNNKNIFFKNNEKTIINKINQQEEQLSIEEFYKYRLFKVHPLKDSFYLKNNSLYVFINDYKKINSYTYSTNLNFIDIYPPALSDCNKFISYEFDNKFIKLLEINNNFKPLSANFNSSNNHFNDLKSPINLKYFECNIIKSFNIKNSLKLKSDNNCYLYVNSILFYLYNFVFESYFIKQNDLYLRNQKLNFSFIFLLMMFYISFLYVFKSQILKIYNIIGSKLVSTNFYSTLDLSNINHQNYMKKIIYYSIILIILTLSFAIKFYIFLDFLIFVFLFLLFYNVFKKI